MHTRSYLLALCQTAWHIGSASAAVYQSRVQERGTIFKAPAEYGTWLMSPYVVTRGSVNIDYPALAYIQTIGTSSGNVEVQVTPSYDGYDVVVSDETSAFTLQNDGVWTLADYDHDGLPDLIYIQNRNTPSGKVEISVASGASGFKTYLVESAETVFDVQVDGRWQMIDVDGDGKLDLVYIQNSNTASNYVEVNIASGASAYTTLTSQTVSSFSIANDGTWLLADWNMSGSYDLFYIQNIATTTGYVEVTVASAASGYQTIIQSVSTTFSLEDNGTWMMYDWNGDDILDLIYIKQDNTAGTVEVHVASGAS
ncbi:hypothetical protein N7466_004814 [Penicillium verhagenii]|uniref:uncharacterized protein n=1 Tax=Penicillium verhagenii TaxID=1562060 RepID=UPI002545429A|nr:uncharacterized protein N7466_004814 [Penicillium verhagenii]KAJ5935267.1 hypothetical protein N7466_004814 [Penicillium verhagenii]